MPAVDLQAESFSVEQLININYFSARVYELLVRKLSESETSSMS